MPFLRYATAKVVHPHVSRGQWSRVRVAGNTAKAAGDMSDNLIQRASGLFEKKFNPEKFLLTHATIIASVDIITPPGVKTGSVVEDGFKVNRKFSDFRIKDASDKYINNNLDAWSRGVILRPTRPSWGHTTSSNTFRSRRCHGAASSMPSHGTLATLSMWTS